MTGHRFVVVLSFAKLVDLLAAVCQGWIWSRFDFLYYVNVVALYYIFKHIFCSSRFFIWLSNKYLAALVFGII